MSASSSKKKLHDNFLSILVDHNLSQMVTEPTREDNILDLILTTQVSLRVYISYLASQTMSLCWQSDSNLASSYTRKLPKKIHLFSKANWAEVRQKISDFSATYLNTMSELDINTKWNALKKQLNDIMDTCITSKMTTTRHNVPWINRTLICLTRKKQRLFNKAKKEEGIITWLQCFFSCFDSSPASTDLSPASTDSSLLAFLLLEPSPLQSKIYLAKKCIF